MPLVEEFGRDGFAAGGKVLDGVRAELGELGFEGGGRRTQGGDVGGHDAPPVCVARVSRSAMVADQKV